MADDPARTGANQIVRRAVLQGSALAAASWALGGGAAMGKPAVSDIVMMDAVALSAAIGSRRVSCAEVMGAYLDHIARFNPPVNAIVALQDHEALLSQARERDAQLARGESRGPLHGFPHAVKDLQPVKGLPFTQGSPIFRDHIAKLDSIMVERLRRAGVIFIGKTNTPEFGLGSHTYNPVYGITRNPYDPSKSAGGSSGGAAVALALRMAPLADGSDYGGSLRNPAGWNNVFGFRTSFGRVPVAGPDVWSAPMSVTGPMARTVDDLALLLSVQAGYDPRAPLSMESSGEGFRQSLAADAKGKRIAWLGDLGGALPYEPGVLALCQEALKTFTSLGCVVEAAHPEFPAEQAWQAFIRLRGLQAGGPLRTLYENPSRRALLKPEATFEVETGARLSAFDAEEASVVRTRWSEAVRGMFERYDYLVLPTAQVFPFAVEQHWPQSIAGRSMRTYHEWMQGVCLITLSGCPALAVPAGFNAEGLPMGLQIIAPVHREMDALRLARAYEAAAPWTSRKPPSMLLAA